MSLKCLYPTLKLKTDNNNYKFTRLNQYNFKSVNDGNIFSCGKCYFCRAGQAQQGTERLKMEQKYGLNTYFVTLTYDNEHINENNELSVRDLQLFFKRLRKKIKMRYFFCGEYGGKTQRPHYHGIIFTNDIINDWKYIKSEDMYYSEGISKTGGKGFTMISHSMPEQLAYVALYTTKKLTKKDRFFLDGNEEIGEFKSELSEKVPEFLLMSKKPMIGYQYMKDNKDYYLSHSHEILKSFLKRTYIFNYKQLEAIKQSRLEYVIEQFYKTDYGLNKINNEKLLQNRKYELKRKRNNI